MVNSRLSQLDETFFALSDPTRRAIVSKLAESESTVAELAEPFELSKPSISKHLRVLERAGLVRQRRDGLGRKCTLDPAPLKEMANWLGTYRRFWTDQLDAFALYAEGSKRESEAIEWQKGKT